MYEESYAPFFILAVLIALALMALVGPAENDALAEHGAWYGKVSEQGAFVM